MEKNILKLNHFIFKFYYKKVDVFFHEWSFFKSISLLIQNYQHLKLLYDNEVKHNQTLIKANDKMRKELFGIKLKQIASDEQIDWINGSFGMDIHKDSEN